MHSTMLEEGVERASNGEACEFEKEKSSEEEELSVLSRHTKVWSLVILTPNLCCGYSRCCEKVSWSWWVDLVCSHQWHGGEVIGERLECY
ncbi:hypothetical protein AMTR_s00083p00097430 [Amborella trichopoda]|uniref:Uncharacterized protein n=1 Tax=Amborella trichopoda TaxID=13333 RepID=W1P6B4_AMBTC|nr:hypothetical protein AMTR_s00083p00097430 [Amborella trichopoda]